MCERQRVKPLGVREEHAEVWACNVHDGEDTGQPGFGLHMRECSGMPLCEK